MKRPRAAVPEFNWQDWLANLGFGSALEHAPVGVAQLALDGRYLRVNAALCHLLGYTERELLGLNIDDVSVREDVAEGRKLRRRAISGEISTFTRDKRYRCKNGDVRWCSVSVQLVRDAGGEPAYFVSVIDDITRRKEAESRFQATFEQVAVGIAHTTPEGRFLSVNQRLCEMVGYSREELLALSTRDLTHPEDRDKQDALRRDLLAGRSTHFTVEKRYLRKNGELMWVNRTVTLARQAADGNPYLIQVFEDITERKLAEHRLARANRARRVLAECGHALVHASDEAAMLEKMCRILVDSGGYKMAWVGLATGDTRQPVNPAAHAGFGQDAPMSAPGAWSAEGRYQGFMRDVIATGEPHIARNILKDPARASRRARAIQHGFQSSIALPLKGEGRVLGAVAIYAREPDAFDTDEITLLNALAEDIAFGIISVRTRIAREQAEARSRETERRYREMFEQAAVGITRVDLNGVLVDANQKFCEMLGYARDDLMGRPLREITHPDDYGQGSQFRTQVVRGAMRSATGEKRFIRRDGSIVWARRTMSTAHDDAGNPQYVISVVEDITDRKQAEAQRQESENRFRATFEQAAVGIVRVGLDNCYLQVNRKFSDMVGYSVDELIGKPATMLSHPGDVRVGLAPREQLLDGRISGFTQEKRYRCKDGTTIWVNRTESLARDEAGNPLYSIRVIEDVTERKQVEERYRTIFENAAVGITRVNLDGILVDVNQKFCDMLGYAREELTGKTIKDITHPDDYGRGERFRTQISQGRQEPIIGEKRFIRKDGGIVWARRTMSVTYDNVGTPQHVISVVEDIAERKRAEEAVARERALLRAVVDAMPERIYVKDREGRFLLQNATNLKIRGVKNHDEIVGKTVFDIFPREMAERLEAEDQAVMKSGAPLLNREGQTFFGGAGGTGGEVRWHVTSKVPLKDEAGEVFAMVGVNRDITDRKRMEEALRESEDRYRSLFELAPLPLLVIEEATLGILATNKAALEKYGYTREEFLSMTVLDLQAPEDRGTVERELRQRDPLKDAFFERRHVTKGGIIIRAEVTARPFLFREQRARMLLVNDVTERRRAQEALRDSEEQLRAMFNQASVGITISALDLQYVQVNDKYCDIVGYSRDELLRMSVREVNFDENMQDAVEYRRKLVAGEIASGEREKQLRRKDGSSVWVSVVTSVIRDNSGTPKHFISVIENISERKRAEAALLESEEQFRQLANNIPQVFWICDAKQRDMIYVSPAYERIAGRPIEPLKTDARGWLAIVHEEDRERVRTARENAASGRYDEVFRVVRPDGTIRWVRDRAFPVRDPDGEVRRITGIAEDITDRRESEERLLYLAHYDNLTSLPNRVLFYDRLKQALSQARRNDWGLAVMFLDLDRFKIVNDTLGHGAGDLLLRLVSERLTGCVRSGDTVGRLSGDEFAIVLSNLSRPDDAGVVAHKIMATFSKPFELFGQEVFVSASIGVTLYPADSLDQDELIQNADAAMYRAKELGRNNFRFYTREMNARALDKLNLESSLRRALERNEFLLYYQPKASLSSGEITGLEALLRWRHPERGLVSPADFMPMLEETGLIIPTGEWVIRDACRQIRAWRDAGLRAVPVAVNLSARQFQAKGLGATILRILEEEGIRHDLLELEITESSLASNTDEAADTLAALNALGVRVAIDDFGTGHSNLSRLKRFPLDALKIDGSFVRDITSDADDAAITRAIITMAHSLELAVVAEGVETEQQLIFLDANGCDQIQGFYFSNPLSAEDCTALMRSGRGLERPGQGAPSGPPAASGDNAGARVD